MESRFTHREEDCWARLFSRKFSLIAPQSWTNRGPLRTPPHYIKDWQIGSPCPLGDQTLRSRLRQQLSDNSVGSAHGWRDPESKAIPRPTRDTPREIETARVQSLHLVKSPLTFVRSKTILMQITRRSIRELLRKASREVSDLQDNDNHDLCLSLSPHSSLN